MFGLEASFTKVDGMIEKRFVAETPRGIVAKLNIFVTR